MVHCQAVPVFFGAIRRGQWDDSSEGDALMSKSDTASPAHVAALTARHADLETRLARESSRPNPDVSLIAQLKKSKLRIKDALPGV